MADLHIDDVLKNKRNDFWRETQDCVDCQNAKEEGTIYCLQHMREVEKHFKAIYTVKLTTLRLAAMAAVKLNRR